MFIGILKYTSTNYIAMVMLDIIMFLLSFINKFIIYSYSYIYIYVMEYDVLAVFFS